MSDVANGIRRAVLFKRVHRKDVAARVGVSPDTLRRWINGVREPTPDQVHRLAYVLDVDPSDLIAGYPDLWADDEPTT